MKLLVPPQSGSLAGQTASRNRFGQYMRSRSIPVNPTSAAQGLVRARLAANSAAWRALTPAQRAGWSDLGLSMVRSDALGQSYALQGNQAHASVNNNRLLTGLAVIGDAPAVATPVALTTITMTCTAAAFSFVFAATPVAAATYIAVFASPQRSAGRNFEGDFRFVKLSAAAAASPLIFTAEYTAKFGIPVLGNKIFLSVITLTLGFQSGPTVVSSLVTA